MILDDLIKHVEWDPISEDLRACYDMSDKDIENHKKVYDFLRDPTSVPFPSKCRISIEHHVPDKFNEDAYYDISGIMKPRDMEDFEENKDDSNAPDPGIEIRCAIEFSPWGKWLGMGIDEETVKSFGPSEIIAHCLYEMTFVGFDENIIQEQFRSLKDQVDEIKRVGVEELEKQGKLKSYKSVDEMMKDMGISRDSSTVEQ